MADANYIVDIIGEIVAEVRAEYDPSNLLAPYYDYGHYLDIANKLTAKDENDVFKFQKYPLIMLALDQTETHGQDDRFIYSFSPKIFIFAETQEYYTSQDRMLNVFKPILYPIYHLLVQKIKESEYFFFDNQLLLPHTKIDRMIWGNSAFDGNTATIFNDYLDGIEIEIDNIRVNKQFTCF